MDLLQVPEWIPEDFPIVEISKERTEGMAVLAIRLDASKPEVVFFLARCSYMQGLHDAINALNKHGYKIVKS